MKIVSIAALALVVTPALAHAEDAAFVIDASTVTREQSGGCTINFVLTNNYAETLQVSGTATLINLESAALGDGSVSFSPALSGQKSLSVAHFYNFNIAGGQCPAEFDVNLTTTY